MRTRQSINSNKKERGRENEAWICELLLGKCNCVTELSYVLMFIRVVHIFTIARTDRQTYTEFTRNTRQNVSVFGFFFLPFSTNFLCVENVQINFVHRQHQTHFSRLEINEIVYFVSVRCVVSFMIAIGHQQRSR